MSRLRSPQTRLESFYALALRLYPGDFRAAYAGPMQRALADALADAPLDRRKLALLVIRDLIFSLVKEHLRMLRETYGRPALLLNAVILSGIATILALALYAIPQQVLRNGANDPQVQMATDLAAKLEAGAAAADSIPTEKVDVARSLAPFVIVYDEQGRPVTGQGKLDGGVPTPPAGIFDYVRQHGEERVSWQPQRGVRIAAVVERVNGSHSGFVLAGRSLREVEMREEQVRTMAGLAWMGMLGLIVAGTLGYGWMTRKQREATAAV